MIPGIVLIIASGLITTWADTVIGLFIRGVSCLSPQPYVSQPNYQHPEVYSVADVGGVMFGKFGREIFGAMYWVSVTR